VDDSGEVSKDGAEVGEVGSGDVSEIKGDPEGLVVGVDDCSEVSKETPGSKMVPK
jgi:hypothetical protein